MKLWYCVILRKFAKYNIVSRQARFTFMQLGEL